MIFQHGGNVWAISEKYNVKLAKLIDFSANINPIDLPDKVKNKLIDNIHLVKHYPEPNCDKLTSELSKSLNVKKERLLIGNGSTELIHLIFVALSPKRVLIPVPTFCEYEHAARVYNTKIKFLYCREEDNFKIDISQLVKHLQGTDLLFICNPNNPTGNILPRSELVYLANKCLQNNAFLVVDEAFINFVKDEDDFSIIHHLNSTIIVLRSFTKFFAIPGLRLGYLVANDNIVKRIKKYQPVWSVNILAQIAGIELIKDKEYIQKIKECVHSEREVLYSYLKNMDDVIKPYPSVTNFILCRFKMEFDYGEIYDELIKKYGIVVRNCNNFRSLSSKYFRVAVRTREENKKLILALQKVLR